ncbi:MAG: lipid II:glycine glycyltransferase FemX [Spirochaetales bacterium]
MKSGAGGPLPEEKRLLRIPIDFPALAEVSAAEALSSQGEESFMQSPFWARFKMKTGWKAYIVYPRSGGEYPGRELIVLARPLGLGFHFAYVPHGPRDDGFGEDAGARLESFGASIIDAIGRKLGGKILFLRFDLAWERTGDASANLLASIDGGKCRMRRGTAVQVPDTVILDIEKTEEAILGAMKPKWRYNIKLAEKKGVEVSEEGMEALDVFYSLYGETAKRDGIAIHPLSYYRTLFEMGENSRGFEGETIPKLSLWVARHEGRPIASIITLFFGKRATYLYGASSGEKRNLMPAYALQWRAIQAARAEGCVDYDFFGIPPDDSPDHPMAGLYLFKTGFGGRIAHRVGCVDYPASPLAYALFRTAESARLFWYKKIKKLLR